MALESLDSPLKLRARVRRSLRASTAEGMLAEVPSAFAGGTVLTAWALYLGCDAWAIGLLGALPFLGQLARLPAAWGTTRLGARRVALTAVAASRLVLALLAPLPLLPCDLATRRLLFVVVAAVSALLSVVGNSAWTVWMGDLVPDRVRGRYFGRRTALCIAASTAAVLVAGVVLEAGRAIGNLELSLALLALAAAVSGIGTTMLMAKQHAVALTDDDEVSLRAALRPLGDEVARRFLAYNIAYSAACGLAAPFFTVFLLRDLRVGFALAAVHATATSLVRVAVAPIWGRLLDRVGARPVLIVCSFGLALVPVPWIFLRTDLLWPLILEPVWSGLFWAGHGLASFELPLRVAPRRGRAYYLAVFAMAGGVAYAAATTLAGGLVEAQGLGLRTIFAASAAARLAASVLSFRLLGGSAHGRARLARRG